MKKGCKNGDSSHFLGEKSIWFLRIVAFFFGFVSIYILIFGELPLGKHILVFDGVSRFIAISPALLAYMLLIVVGELECYHYGKEKKHKKE